MNAAPATFDVIDHFSVTGRGVVIAGKITEGTFRVGMFVPTGETEMPLLTISSIEFIDVSIAKRIHQEGLMFREHPSLQLIEKAFPKGSTLLAFKSKPPEPNP